MTTLVKIPLLAAVAALALVAGACSSDDDSASDPANAPAEDVAGGDGASGADDTDGTAGDGDAAGGSGGDSATASGGSLSTSEFCRYLEEFDDSDVDPTESSPEEIEKALAQFRELASKAPSEISDDLGVLGGVLEKIAKFSVEADAMGDDATPDMSMLSEMMTLMMDPAVLEASENIDAFLVEECGHEPSIDDDDFDMGDLDLDDLDFDFDFDDAS